MTRPNSYMMDVFHLPFQTLSRRSSHCSGPDPCGGHQGRPSGFQWSLSNGRLQQRSEGGRRRREGHLFPRSPIFPVLDMVWKPLRSFPKTTHLPRRTLPQFLLLIWGAVSSLFPSGLGVPATPCYDQLSWSSQIGSLTSAPMLVNTSL